MNVNSQLLKGTLEGCILKILEQDETYGYEIVEKLHQYGFSDISEGTVYPLLLRLHNSGYLSANAKVSPYGPKRKYYTLTSAGQIQLQTFIQEWEHLSAIIKQVLNNKEV
jgi:PadR family transcriptional regulator PadR